MMIARINTNLAHEECHMMCGFKMMITRISTNLMYKVLLMYTGTLNVLIFDALYGIYILSLPLFTLGTIYHSGILT